MKKDMPSRRGRPALPPSIRKSRMLCTRIDGASFRSCQRAARMAGLRFTDWVRARLGEAARRDLDAAT